MGMPRFWTALAVHGRRRARHAGRSKLLSWLNSCMPHMRHAAAARLWGAQLPRVTTSRANRRDEILEILVQRGHGHARVGLHLGEGTRVRYIYVRDASRSTDADQGA